MKPMPVLSQALRTQLQQLDTQQQQRSDAAAQPATSDTQPGMAKALAEAEVTIVKRKVQDSQKQRKTSWMHTPTALHQLC